MDSLREIDIAGFTGVIFLTELGSAPQLQWVAVADLRIDERYQRQIGQRGRMQIRRIAERFRWSRFAPIIVAPIEGGLFAVIDGQHRSHAAKLRGVKQVPCMVVPVDTAEQAEAFVEINTRQLNVKPAAIHRSKVLSGDAEAIAVQSVCEQAGVRMVDNLTMKNMKRGDTLSVAAVYKARELYGDEVLTSALEAIVKAGAGNIGLVRANVITAYCSVFHNEPSWREDDRLLDVLDEFDLQAAFQRMQVSTAHTGAARWRALADELAAYLGRLLPRAAA
jgi:hypothetical protein